MYFIYNNSLSYLKITRFYYFILIYLNHIYQIIKMENQDTILNNSDDPEECKINDSNKNLDKDLCLFLPKNIVEEISEEKTDILDKEEIAFSSTIPQPLLTNGFSKKLEKISNHNHKNHNEINLKNGILNKYNYFNNDNSEYACNNKINNSNNIYRLNDCNTVNTINDNINEINNNTIISCKNINNKIPNNINNININQLGEELQILEKFYQLNNQININKNRNNHNGYHHINNNVDINKLQLLNQVYNDNLFNQENLNNINGIKNLNQVPQINNFNIYQNLNINNNNLNNNNINNNFNNQFQFFNNDFPNSIYFNYNNNSNNPQIQNYINIFQNDRKATKEINGKNGTNGINGYLHHKTQNYNNKNGHNGVNHINGFSYKNNHNSSEDSSIDLLFKQILNSNNKKPNIIFLIEKLGKNFIELIKTYKGSRYFQELLPKEKISKKESNFITKVIGKNFNEIICDYYGNYFLQKLFPILIREDRIRVYNYIQNNFIKISCDISGNYSLQCLILLTNSNEEKIIIKKLTINNLDILCFDQNGSHIIEKIIIVFKEIEREYLNKYIMDNLIKLSMDINGSVVVKAFLINIKNDYFIKEIVIIFGNETNTLCFNQFGSDIIITFLGIYGYYSIKIINILINNIVNLSISKYSSNVILFLLDYLKENNFFKFLDCLKLIFIDENNFKEMIKNKFSSFVIEKSFKIIINIDADFFNKNIRIKDISDNFNSSDSSDSKDDDEKEDEKQIDHDIIINKNEEIKNNSKDSTINYDKFLELKNKIFYIFENNSSNKEKEKIINLLKQNFNYKNFLNNKNGNGNNHKNKK